MNKNELRPYIIGLLAGVATACLFAIAGLALLKTGRLGVSIFLMLPVATGFAVAMAAWPRPTIWWSLVFLVLTSVIGLIASGLEGWVCCLMALPLIVPGLICGALFGLLIRRWARQTGRRLACIALAVVLLPVTYAAEQKESETKRVETVKSSVLLKAAPQEVWERIKSIDQVDGERSFWLKIGLPVPKKCVLFKEAVGGKRVCYFSSGEIYEEITGWSPPYRMEVRIVKSTLPGRHWLGFVDARYELQSQGSYTLLSRTTRISSRLEPAWYWRRMEHLGVQVEHEYILKQLERVFDKPIPKVVR